MVIPAKRIATKLQVQLAFLDFQCTLNYILPESMSRTLTHSIVNARMTSIVFDFVLRETLAPI